MASEMFSERRPKKLLSPEYLEVNLGRCLRSRHMKSGCRLCLETCPLGGISFSEGLQIDHSLCSGCGICAGTCPNSVFGLRDYSQEAILASVRQKSEVEFTCSALPPESDGFRVPCLGYLDEAVLIGVVASGSQAVRLNAGQCKRCRYGVGLRVAVKSMKRANRILALFGLPKRISVSAKEPGGGYSLGENELYSRREFFSYLRKETQSRMASTIESAISAREIAAKTKVTLEARLPKKRSLLLEHIKHLGQPVTNLTKADDLPFARVEIGDGCDGCGMCVAFCPTGALKSYEEGDRQVVDFSSGYCLACGLCADICPQGTVAYSASVNPWDLVTDSRTILVEHRKSACVQCGQTYIAVSGSRLCPNCRKKKEMEEWLARIWHQS